MTDIPSLTMNDGLTIPQLGFGVFQMPQDEPRSPSPSALSAGYRLIDTAQRTRTRRASARRSPSSGLAARRAVRHDQAVQRDQGYDKRCARSTTSMAKLGLDVLDLYLIHWPRPKRDQYVDSWRAFEKLHADGRVRSIGVSNFESSTSSGWRTRPTSCRRSTRSSCTPGCRRRSCATTTTSTAS